MKKKVLLIFGGKSAEHEISLLSARNVCSAIDRTLYDVQLVGISQEGTWYAFSSDQIFSKLKVLSEKNLPQGAEPCALISREGKPFLFELQTGRAQSADIAFPILHGTFGEDGCIQGLFKMANIPFVGCGVLGSAAGMDKEVMKRIFSEAKIPTARYELLTPQSPKSFQELSNKLGTPFFIKPANMGSSVGVHKIKSEKDFETSLRDAFLYDHKVLAEEFIEGREIECSVMGHNFAPKASVCGEVTPSHEFYSYEAKYLDEKGAALQIPAKMDHDTLQRIQTIACKTFQVMGCEGMTRVDFFLKKNGEAIVNEINTIPGFTKISMYPKMWEASGVSYTELISQLLKLGFEAYERDQCLQTKFPGI